MSIQISTKEEDLRTMSNSRHRTLEEVKEMLDAIVKNEKEPDVVQISGGEPTI